MDLPSVVASGGSTTLLHIAIDAAQPHPETAAFVEGGVLRQKIHVDDRDASGQAMPDRPRHQLPSDTPPLPVRVNDHIQQQ